MSSGGKRVIYNTRERVISPDQNRAQAFSQAEAAEVMRQRATQTQIWETSTSGRLASTVTAPEAGAVLQGLFVIAPLASLELGVEPGMAIFIDPDGQLGSTVPLPPNSDDSPGKLCFDPLGVIAGSGTLVFTPNGGGAVRVDVVEIQRDPGQVLETDNRDIFDPGTGLFTPATVNKVMRDGIKYRIRLGVAGAGLPANALGWMPIAVICTPNGAPNFDTCTIYDVRPLESDRPSPGARIGRLAPEITRSFYVDSVTTPGVLRCTGRIEGPGVDGFWTGGDFSVDLRTATIREPGFGAITANQLVYLWALYPGGLPRWVRYSTVAVAPFGGRVPVGFRGIFCLSKKAPLAFGYAGLNPATPVALPLDSGFDAGAAAFGQLMLANANDSTGVTVASIANCKRGRMAFGFAAPAPVLSPVPSVAASIDTYPLNYGTIIPYGARAVLVQVEAVFTAAPGTEFTYLQNIMLQHPTLGGPVFSGDADVIDTVIPSGGTLSVSFIRWVDLITDYSNVTLALLKQVLEVRWSQPGGVVKSAEAAFIRGWEL